MEEFKNPCTIALSAGIISVGISYGESKLSNIKRDKTHYLKLFLLVVFIVLISLNVNNLFDIKGNLTGGELMNKEIMTGNPDF